MGSHRSSTDDPDQDDEQEQDLQPPTAGLGYTGDYVYIDGIHIRPDDRPDCLWADDFECSFCEFFSPRTCRLRRDPGCREETKILLDLYRERRERHRARQRAILEAITSELKAHGRPLHYTVLARMVIERNPQLQATESSVLHIMAHHTDLFEAIGEGVYKYRSGE